MDEQQQKEFRTVRGYEAVKGVENTFSSAMEDYLEMTARLCAANGRTRVGHLSAALKVKPSSASKMISRLLEAGYVNFDHNNCLYLTSSGNKKATYLLYRHETIERFLLTLGSDDALRETELIEHGLSPKTVAALERVTQLLESQRTEEI